MSYSIRIASIQDIAECEKLTAEKDPRGAEIFWSMQTVSQELPEPTLGYAMAVEGDIDNFLEELSESNKEALWEFVYKTALSYYGHEGYHYDPPCQLCYFEVCSIISTERLHALLAQYDQIDFAEIRDNYESDEGISFLDFRVYLHGWRLAIEEAIVADGYLVIQCTS